ncbi:MAG: L,D-transpeptidase [Francisellaceae bacterium]|nr:L,D-transpeptidase [Francisellaceae bacterium]
MELRGFAFMNYLLINITEQKLYLIHKPTNTILKTYLISSGLYGVGEENGSGKTPRGWHQIRAKIGQNALINTVFKGRRPTGEIFSEALFTQFPNRDWILTRILWLSGLELGYNRLGNKDTMRRYIYIHGTPDQTILGKPGSKGCIRMANLDIIELFDMIPAHIHVNIITS